MIDREERADICVKSNSFFLLFILGLKRICTARFQQTSYLVRAVKASIS